MLAGGILMAGTDTTRNQVAAAVDVFCDHPDQWELLAEHPELAMNAVEEVMRYYPVVFGAMRMTTEDVEIEGVVIPAGTFVMVNTAVGQPRPPRVRRAGSASTSRARARRRCRPSARARTTASARTWRAANSPKRSW